MLSLLGIKGIAILVAAGVLLGGLTFISTKIYLAGQHAAEVRQLNDTIALMKAQQARDKAAAEADQKAAAEAEAKAVDMENKIKTLTDGVTAGDCLPAEDVERLRKLWEDNP